MKAENATFAVAYNGFGEDGNAQAFLEYLRQRGARAVVEIQHPLLGERGLHRHVMTVHRRDGDVTRRELRAPHYPPVTYPLDLILPLTARVMSEPIDLWVGFGNLNAIRGLYERARGRVRRVVYDCVDFTPDRFGARTLATRAYDLADRLAYAQADAIWPLSQASHDARCERLGLRPTRPVEIVPMGAWLTRTPKVRPEAFAERRVVFLGGLLEKQGVQLVLHALGRLRERGAAPIHFDVIGRGPYQPALEALTRELDLTAAVTFHGFVKDHHDVEKLLARGTLAVGTYLLEIASFSRYADAGKLKAYLGASLPCVLTDVTPNAREIAERAGGELVDGTAGAVASGIEAVLSDEGRWRARVDRAHEYAKQFDWLDIFDRALASLD